MRGFVAILLAVLIGLLIVGFSIRTSDDSIRSGATQELRSDRPGGMSPGRTTPGKSAEDGQRAPPSAAAEPLADRFDSPQVGRLSDTDPGSESFRRPESAETIDDRFTSRQLGSPTGTGGDDLRRAWKRAVDEQARIAVNVFEAEALQRWRSLRRVPVDRAAFDVLNEAIGGDLEGLVGLWSFTEIDAVLFDEENRFRGVSVASEFPAPYQRDIVVVYFADIRAGGVLTEDRWAEPEQITSRCLLLQIRSPSGGIDFICGDGGCGLGCTLSTRVIEDVVRVWCSCP